MKKRLSLIILCIIISISSYSVSAVSKDINPEPGFNIEFNGEGTGYMSIIRNDMHFLPLRMVFEKMGATLYYRDRDAQILALSRDGDMISHIVGSNVIIVNDVEKSFANASFSKDEITYIPMDMFMYALCPDGVSYYYPNLNIQKYFFNENYHRIIKDVMDVSKTTNFHPERFKRYIKFHGDNPAYSIEEVILRVNIGIDYPFYQNMVTTKNPYDLLVMVNKYNQLPTDFSQYNLVSMNPELTARDGKAYLLAGVAYEKYIEMYNASRNEGLSMKVVSAYRTENYQRNLYNSKVRATGKINADNYSARAGHSEHQTGLAVDINSTKTSFEYSAEFKWLQAHAHEYGFILRYPKGKEWITGYAYEPWHYRYVGEEVATKIYNEGITYEEFYAKYVDVSEFK